MASLVLTSSVIAQTHAVCPGPSTLPGVDVSYRQGTIDWNAAAASGIKFAFAPILASQLTLRGFAAILRVNKW
jgi:hypothetical protein